VDRFGVGRARLAARGLALAAVLGLPACASAGGRGGGGSAGLITQQQIDEAGVGTALEVVQRYRPRWLRASRSGSFGTSAPTSRPGMPQRDGDAVATEVYASVFLDGAPYGDLSTLSSISANAVQTMEFVSASDATTRYGTGYGGGVIEVHTR
jgi:hypothetical protein